MSDPFKRSLKLSTMMHALLVLAFIVGSMVSSCHIRKPKEEVMMVELTVALPQAPAEEEPVPEPKAPEPPKVPEKAPEPPKQDIPEKQEPPKPKPPEPPKPKKPTIERSTNRVVRKDIPTSKMPPKGPVLSPEEIKRLLAAGARISDTTSVPDNWEVTGYYQKIGDRIQRVWAAQSDAVPPGYSGQVVIRVQRNGTISSASLRQSCGNPSVDASLMRAVRTMTKVDPLPKGISGAAADIVVYFDTDRLAQ